MERNTGRSSPQAATFNLRPRLLRWDLGTPTGQRFSQRHTSPFSSTIDRRLRRISSVRESNPVSRWTGRCPVGRSLHRSITSALPSARGDSCTESGQSAMSQSDNGPGSCSNDQRSCSSLLKPAVIALRWSVTMPRKGMGGRITPPTLEYGSSRVLGSAGCTCRRTNSPITKATDPTFRQTA